MNQPIEYPSLDRWPLILAGPILRRTEPKAVTVWLALQTACQVSLAVYQTAQKGTVLTRKVLVGVGETVALGERLHVVAVTAYPVGEEALSSEVLYAYDLQFRLLDAEGSLQSLEQALTGPGESSPSLSYFPHQKPTFALPPRRIEHLRLVHGSCRKPHGEGFDSLPILDSLVQANADQPLHRPHQLFLTGDQIYGDDVADPLLWVATHLGDALLGWKEVLPVGHEVPTRRRFRIIPRKLLPGKRGAIATRKGGFTAGLDNKHDKVSSHLLGLGEFFATYLLAWSPVCWPAQFPAAQEIAQGRKEIRVWNRQVADLQQFAHTLWKVRRVLANIPTYTLFDDHDVSDDWNLNQAWCLRVLGQPLGQRTVQNALTACAVFQAWGNTPWQFANHQSGHKLLQAIQAWSGSRGKDNQAYTDITRYLGLPDTDPVTNFPQFSQDGPVWILQRHLEAVTWHYTVQSECHELIALDTRTWRGYPIEGRVIAPPRLLSPQALEDQVSGLLGTEKAQQRLTLLISPTNVFSLEAIDWAQKYYLKQDKVFAADVGDAWNFPSDALAAFLVRLFQHRKRVIILSGDIHYSFAVRLSFAKTSGHPADQAAMIQLTASPFKNEEPLTRIIHTRLKQWLLPERTRRWRGWSQPPHMQEQSRWSLGRTPSQPDWICALEWMPRQAAAVPEFGKQVSWLEVRSHSTPNWLKPLQFWKSRWFQEGGEVVGLNNLALVQFELGETPDTVIVNQDTYWFSPWSPVQIMCSRFSSPLTPNQKLIEKV
ncbi:MAG TPA: PhoD-like phosphatase [Leptolyngbyaceae cyanobacterium]